jgi:L,D-transpeptidase YcbB
MDRILLSRRSALTTLGAAAAGLAWPGFGALPALARPSAPAAFRAGQVALLSQATLTGLETTLAGYRRVAAAGGWPQIAATRLQSGQTDPQVVNLRRRLIATGDLVGDANSTTFDTTVSRAVAGFQARHGIPTTGSVFGLTLAHMNVPADTRVRQLEGNIARLRAVLSRVQNPHIVVNTPSFELQAVGTQGTVDVASLVIVGKRSTPTPDVSVTVRAVDLLPFWHVPSSVARDGLVPAVRKDPTYLSSRVIRVFTATGGGEVDPSTINWHAENGSRFVFRQDPGPLNALGFIRLDMPNKHIVYMHDTPMRELFGHAERAYSAGCIRVQNIRDLAAWVAQGTGLSRAAIDAAIEAKQKQTTTLPRPVPVHFVYLTAWVQDGIAHFRNDLYNRDVSASVTQGEDRATKAPFQLLSP